MPPFSGVNTALLFCFHFDENRHVKNSKFRSKGTREIAYIIPRQNHQRKERKAYKSEYLNEPAAVFGIFPHINAIIYHRSQRAYERTQPRRIQSVEQRTGIF